MSGNLFSNKLMIVAGVHQYHFTTPELLPCLLSDKHIFLYGRNGGAFICKPVTFFKLLVVILEAQSDTIIYN